MKLYKWDKNSLQTKPISIFKVILLSILIFAISIMSTAYIFYENGLDNGKKQEITPEEAIIILNDSENSSFTPRKFYEYMKEVGIKFPKIVFGQAIKECGFKSPIFLQNNNPYGMREATMRPNMQSGVQFGHAYFNNWKDAVIDYGFYQCAIGAYKIKTEDQYLQYLVQMKYFDVSDPVNVQKYLSDVRNIADHIEDYMK